MKKFTIAALTMACLLSAGIQLQAQIVAENPDPADTTIDTHFSGDGTPAINPAEVTDYQARIGELFAPGVSIAVLPFILPTLPAGEVFTDASLEFELFGYGNTNQGNLANVDLYGLSARATPTVLASDFYAGATPDTSTNATLLQAGILTPANSTTPSFVTTSTQGDISLAAYLNAQYALSGPGSYVFLRFSYDQNPSVNGNNFYSILTDNAGGATEKPVLSLTEGVAAIPEPSSVAFLLIGFGAGAVGLCRKRRAV